MEYYTYVLIDSRTDEIFYVGKGQKMRMYHHVNEVQRGRIPNNGTNVYLERKIKKILDSGSRIKYKKILITENEQESYDKEMKLIAEIGLKNLCNITGGGKGGEGKKHSDETKIKMSENSPKFWLGKKFSDSHRQKLSESRRCQSPPMLGKRHSEETCRKLSESHKGQIPWIKGKKHSNEVKKKMSQKAFEQFINGMPEEIKRKISESNKGKKRSDITRKKISDSKKGLLTWSKGTCWISSSEQQKSIMVKKDILLNYLNNGWYRGRTFLKILS